MTEFGHIASVVDGFCIDSWGAGPFVIVAGGKAITFEDSDRFGPVVLTKKSNPIRGYLRENHPFWRAHRIWVRQGRRVADDKATCIWDEPKPSKVRMLNRRNVFVLESGEEDGAMLIEGRDFPADESNPVPSLRKLRKATQ